VKVFSTPRGKRSPEILKNRLKNSLFDNESAYLILFHSQSEGRRAKKEFSTGQKPLHSPVESLSPFCGEKIIEPRFFGTLGKLCL
jgi:hypothetical protein